MLPALSYLAGVTAMALIAVCTLTDYLPQYRALAVKFWYLPAALAGGSMVLALLVYLLLAITDSGTWMAFHANLSTSRLMMTLAFGFAGAWMAPEGLDALGSKNEFGYYSIVKHTLLLIFTFGIWYCIWIYRVTGYLNRTAGEDRNPVSKLLLCMFVPYYLTYWIYKSCLSLDRVSVENRIFGNLTTLCTLISLILPILAPIMMQDRINAIVSADMLTDFDQI